FRGGDVEDDVGESERADEFRDQGGQDVQVGGVAAAGRFTFQVKDDEGCGQGADDLGDHVGNDICLGATSAQPDGQGDGGVIMRAGDVAAGVDHDHQGQADRQRREGRSRVDDVHTDGQDQKECADKFYEIFFHDNAFQRDKLQKAVRFCEKKGAG